MCFKFNSSFMGAHSRGWKAKGGGIGMRGRSGRFALAQGAGAFALYPCICPLPLVDLIVERTS